MKISNGKPTPEHLRELADTLVLFGKSGVMVEQDTLLEAARHLRNYASLLQEKTLNAGVAPEVAPEHDKPGVG